MNKRRILSSSTKSFGGNENGIELSVRGAGHIKIGKVCQDFGGHIRCDRYAVAVVCDGHGGDAYIRSDRGSKFCVEETLEAIRELMMKKGIFLKQIYSEAKRRFNTDKANILSLDYEKLQICASSVMKQLTGSIISRWNIRVAEDMEKDPFTEAEFVGLSEKCMTRYLSDNINDRFSAYGTTLIVVVYAPECWFGIRIGDGKCVAVGRAETLEETSVRDPIPWNEKCFLNTTVSLCDRKVIDESRYCFYLSDFPAAIYVGTDGVDDTFGTDRNLFRFYKRLTQSFAENGFEGGKKELAEYLPELSQKGSRDDISISGIVDMEAVQSLFPREEVAENPPGQFSKATGEAESETPETDIQNQ
jgi:hypothetical protein